MSTLLAQKWKYATIALVALVGIGLSVPQAFAHTTNSVQHMVEHILETVTAVAADTDAIEAKIDDLPQTLQADLSSEIAAAQEAINSNTDSAASDIQDSQLEVRNLSFSDTTNADTAQTYRLDCSEPYIIESIRVFTTSDPGDDWNTPVFGATGFVRGTTAVDPPVGSQLNQNVPLNVGTFPQTGVTLSKSAVDGGEDTVIILYFITIPQSATCTTSKA